MLFGKLLLEPISKIAIFFPQHAVLLLQLPDARGQAEDLAQNLGKVGEFADSSGFIGRRPLLAAVSPFVSHAAIIAREVS